MKLRQGCLCPIGPICCTKIGSLQRSQVKGSTEGSSYQFACAPWGHQIGVGALQNGPSFRVLLWKYCGTEFDVNRSV